MSNKDDANSEGTAGLKKNGERWEVRAHCSAPGRGWLKEQTRRIIRHCCCLGRSQKLDQCGRQNNHGIKKTGKLEVAQDNSALDTRNVLAPRHAHEGRHPQGS